jgi:hypothetical protein
MTYNVSEPYLIATSSSRNGKSPLAFLALISSDAHIMAKENLRYCYSIGNV